MSQGHGSKAGVFFVVALVGLIAWKFVEPMISARVQSDISDASGTKGVIKIAVDGWVGYFPACSPEIKKRLHRSGYGLKCVDDAADYKDRYKRLKKGEYTFAMGTVDSYILNGEDYDYPGPIVAVIDESKGGDAVLAWKDKYPTLDSLKVDPNIKVAYTPASPSHHLMKAISTHFDVSGFRTSNAMIESNGSEDALKIFLAKKSDIAVLWEPDVSKAMESDGVVRLLGTEDTQQLIVDILIANQKVVKNDPELIKLFMKEYFKTLKFYRDNQDELVDDIASHYKINKKTTAKLLNGVKWAGLNENAEHWFGATGNYSDEALVETIESAVAILLDNNDFDSNPLPGEDPYRIVSSRFVKDLNQNYSNTGGFTTPGGKVASTNAPSFSKLNKSAWDALKPVGSLKVQKIVFASGTSNLTLKGKEMVDALMDDLQHYPNFRVEVRGHTGIRGDAHANIALSQSRAESVLRYMQVEHSIEDNRARHVGLGGSLPLIQRPSESSRAYNRRLPRVEITLVREVI